MKILFLNPPFYAEHWFGIRAGCRWSGYTNGAYFETIRREIKEQPDKHYATYPFFMGFAASILNEQGHEAKIYDALALCHTYAEFYERIRQEKPDKCVIEVVAASYEQDLYILQNLKEMGIHTIICGSIVKPKLEELKKLKFIDEIWEGNYVYTLLGSDDVSKLPMPYRDDEAIYRYSDYTQFPNYVKKPQLQVWTSLGCPYNCTFCLWRHTITMGKYKPRPIPAIKKELQYCIDRWNFKSILFDDDTFNVGDKHPIEISKMMTKDIKLPWMAMVRADSCSLDTFKKMYDSGCNILKVGVETFSPSVLNKIKKGLDADDLVKRIIQLHDIGFFVYLSTMSHIPGETERDRAITQQILDEMHKIGIRYQRPLAMPIPGTPMYDDFMAKNKDYDPDLFDFGDFDTNPELKRRVKEYSGDCKCLK